MPSWRHVYYRKQSFAPISTASRTLNTKGEVMIPPELSKELLDKFQFAMRGKWNQQTRNPEHFTKDLQTALDLIGETAIRWALERQNKCSCGECQCK
jgi:hypothetical protein